MTTLKVCLATFIGGVALMGYGAYTPDPETVTAGAVVAVTAIGFYLGMR